jgi:hypothetical protein
LVFSANHNDVALRITVSSAIDASQQALPMRGAGELFSREIVMGGLFTPRHCERNEAIQR